MTEMNINLNSTKKSFILAIGKSTFRSLILFRKPKFAELDFVDLIIEDKPLFLIAWKIKNGYSIKLNPLHKTVRKVEGSFISELPPNTNSIELIASNFWRKNKRRIYLKHTKLNDVASQALIQQFKPLSTVEISDLIISTKNCNAIIKQANIQTRPFAITMKYNPNIKSTNINYP